MPHETAAVCVHHATMYRDTSCKTTYLRCMRVLAVTYHLHLWQNDRHDRMTDIYIYMADLGVQTNTLSVQSILVLTMTLYVDGTMKSNQPFDLSTICLSKMINLCMYVICLSPYYPFVYRPIRRSICLIKAPHAFSSGDMFSLPRTVAAR